jgi:hypothetical protein
MHLADAVSPPRLIRCVVGPSWRERRATLFAEDGVEDGRVAAVGKRRKKKKDCLKGRKDEGRKQH